MKCYGMSRVVYILDSQVVSLPLHAVHKLLCIDGHLDRSRSGGTCNEELIKLWWRSGSSKMSK